MDAKSYKDINNIISYDIAEGYVESISYNHLCLHVLL